MNFNNRKLRFISPPSLANNSSNNQPTTIYTDWANHYLQKRYEELDSDYGSSCDKEDEYNSRYQSVQPRRRFITSLANDLQDGILLASIVESVSETTLENVTKMPKTSNEMIENIELAIKFLSHLGVNVNEIQAKDIYEGNLKSILTLFFNVSRYKQSLKSSTGKASNDTSGYSSDSGIALIRPNHSESSHGIILNSATPSANMISRLPSSSSSTSTAFNSSRLPSTTTRIVTHQTQQQHNPQPQLSGNSQPQSSIPSGTSNRRITSSSSSKQTSTNNNTLGIHRSASPATQSTVTPNSFSIAQPSRFSAKQPTLRSSSQPQTSSSTGAASRPNSITSIPQIGSLATNVVTSPKSSAFATTQSRVNGTSSSISGPSTTRTIQSNVNNRTNESSLNNGSTLKSKQTQSSSINSGLRANTSGVGGGGSNTVKYRSSVNSESASSSTTSLASSSNGTSSKPYSTQLNSLKGSATRIGSLSSLKRTQPSTSGTSRSRPISTIVETNSSIPNRSSMIMATSSMNGTNLSNAASQLANTKPTATVKAMVTPIMSTSIKKRTEPKSKSVNHNDQTTSATVKLNKAMEELKKSKKNLDNNQDDGDETSSQSTEDPIGEPVESNANCDDDSGSSHSSSDIESALANIEPMQPINLERPSIHSFTYLKGQSQQSQINSNQQNRQYQTSTQLQSNKSNYCEDFSDNSESPNRIKSSRMTIPNYAYIGDDGNCSISNHLSNSNTLLNLHLRPNRSNSLRAKNAKSQSELGSIW
ncbi:hypothetical protein RDWZM_004519 [Blomia tropicalis]|uniref:Calponin-homology (CH) domain-containing protein n=1 Tax=Blomia tropicalis TaxID=40697 RepID=A0A9Q0M498_BLOTA|nr:hypothetical protein RDWZM_004519 [Blomia tropicalis]